MSDLEQAGIHKSNFHLPEPRPPFRDLWTCLLMIMSFVIACGFAAYAFMGWMFGEIESLAGARTVITTIGALTLAIGGELTTPLTVWEVYRKTQTKTISKWDWSALIASITATLIGLLLGAAGLIQVSETAMEAARVADLQPLVNILSFLNLWPDIVKGYGPLILVFTAAADGYAHFIETGLRIGSYDRRHEAWQRKYEKWSKWGAAQVGFAQVDERLDVQEKQAYNEVGGVAGNHWPDEPPVKPGDTPVKMLGLDYRIDFGGDGSGVSTRKLDTGEVKIEDIEYLHPAVARAILSDE